MRRVVGNRTECRAVLLWQPFLLPEHLLRSILLFGLLLASSPRPDRSQAPTEIRIGAVAAPIPEGAILAPHPHGEGRYHGTRIRLEERLTIEVAALPDTSTPLDRFVDSLIVARNIGVPPTRRLGAPERRQVGDRVALVVHPRCGDCQSVEAFLDFPHTRVVVAWGVDGLPPLSAEARHALAWAFVASLHPIPRPHS